MHFPLLLRKEKMKEMWKEMLHCREWNKQGEQARSSPSDLHIKCKATKVLLLIHSHDSKPASSNITILIWRLMYTGSFHLVQVANISDTYIDTYSLIKQLRVILKALIDLCLNAVVHIYIVCFVIPTSTVICLFFVCFTYEWR